MSGRVCSLLKCVHSTCARLIPTAFIAEYDTKSVYTAALLLAVDTHGTIKCVTKFPWDSGWTPRRFENSKLRHHHTNGRCVCSGSGALSPASQTTAQLLHC